MGRKSLEVKGYTSEQIKSLFKKDDRYKMGMRLYAVYQVSLGKPSRALEELYNTSFKQITNWVHRFEAEGLEGLRDKPRGGRKRRLSGEQEAAIRHLLLEESPLGHGYNTSTWTGPLLIDWIEKRFGISFKKAQIYNVIKSLGLSHQRSRGHYPEADPQQQEAFKESLKKNSSKAP